MIPLLLELRLLTTAMAGWTAAMSPVPLPVDAVGLAFEMRAATPVEVNLYDENLKVHATVLIDHAGNSDLETTKQIRHLFRCRETNRQRPIARQTLAMLADVAERYEGKTIEFVSAHRARRGESRTSPHRHGRAIDFRIPGVKLREVRDYVWTKYTEVGVGYYPQGRYMHMDSRPGKHDTSWTFLKGKNHYNPSWAERARRKAKRGDKPAVVTAHARRAGS